MYARERRENEQNSHKCCNSAVSHGRDLAHGKHTHTEHGELSGERCGQKRRGYLRSVRWSLGFWMRRMYTLSNHRGPSVSDRNGASVTTRHCLGRRGMRGAPVRKDVSASGGSSLQFPCTMHAAAFRIQGLKLYFPSSVINERGNVAAYVPTCSVIRGFCSFTFAVVTRACICPYM